MMLAQPEQESWPALEVCGKVEPWLKLGNTHG